MLEDSWYTYDLEQMSLTTTNFWPQSYISSRELRANAPLSLNLAVDYQAQISFSFLSPNQQYVVYAAQRPENWGLSGWPLAITNLQTGPTVFATTTSVHNLAHFDSSYRVNWSANSSAFTVKTTSPYAADYVYYVTGFAENMQEASFTRLQELSVADHTLFVSDTFASLSSNGRRIVLTGNLGGDVQPRKWLFIWDADNSIQGQLIEVADQYDFIAAAFTSDSSSILYIGENGLIKYELETGKSTILNSEINSTWAERVWFSPDMRYVALLVESRGEMYIAEVPSS
ncbi:MAG: hypothetical protein H7Y09_11015 [Chitinophagaceae bacterium]|nr:hypothetical protein [Anaerolineae bacterium]